MLFLLALLATSASESVEAFDDLIDYGTGALLRLLAASKKRETWPDPLDDLKLGLTPWMTPWMTPWTAPRRLEET